MKMKGIEMNLYADDEPDFEQEELARFRFAEPGHDGGREHVMVCGEKTALAIREELHKEIAQ